MCVCPDQQYIKKGILMAQSKKLFGGHTLYKDRHNISYMYIYVLHILWSVGHLKTLANCWRGGGQPHPQPNHPCVSLPFPVAGHKRWVLFPPHAAREVIKPRMPGGDREAIAWFHFVYPRMLQDTWKGPRPVEILQSPGACAWFAVTGK